METSPIEISVIMQRQRLNNRWQSHQWRPLEIVSDTMLQGARARCLRNDPDDARWLFPSFEIRLYSDEGEGYFLNISAPVPCWFVMWRMEEHEGEEIGVPKVVTLSYNEAARLMDGGERVDTLPAAPEVVARLRAFVDDFYHPQAKQKRRKPSFEGGAEIERMRDSGAAHGG
jgi:hypothetical protein